MFYIVVTSLPIIGAIIYFLFVRIYLSRKREFVSMSQTAMSSSFFDNVNSLDYIKQMVQRSTHEDVRTELKRAIGSALTDHETDKILSNFRYASRKTWFPPKDLESMIVGKAAQQQKENEAKEKPPQQQQQKS